MNQSAKSTLCNICRTRYTQANPARSLRRCAHVYCENCIKTTTLCPVDKLPLAVDYNRYKADAFPIHTAIMQIVAEEEELERLALQQQHSQKACNKHAQLDPKAAAFIDDHRKCLLHDKPLDLICLDQMQRICSSCALFGDHRQHIVDTFDIVITECTRVAEQTVIALETINELKNTLNVEMIEDRVIALLREKRDASLKAIKLRFKKVAEKLRKLEMAAVTKLDQLIQQQKDQLIQNLKIDDYVNKRDAWEGQANDLLNLIDKNTIVEKIQEAAKYINSSFPESTIAKRGQYLIVEINSFNTSLENKIISLVEEKIYEFDDSLEAKLDTFLVIDKDLKQIEPVSQNTKKQDEDNLLLMISETQDFGVSSIGKNDITPDTSSSFCQSIDRFGAPVNSFGLDADSNNQHQFMTLRSNVTINEMQQPRKKPTMPSQSVLLGSPPPLNKKLRIPEKYQQIVEDLRNDKLEVVDLGGAELGDSIIISLCEYIRCSQRLRTLKLVRNKLTDESLLPLIQACAERKVSSLNLGQNLMTDRALEILQSVGLGELRMITLSQNKLKERNCKAKIVEFKKLGITVSI